MKESPQRSNQVNGDTISTIDSSTKGRGCYSPSAIEYLGKSKPDALVYMTSERVNVPLLLVVISSENITLR